jgi:hypothetical protein
VDPDLSSTNQPYEYADDDPVNDEDPSGLFPGQSALDALRHEAAAGADSLATGLGDAADEFGEGLEDGVGPILDTPGPTRDTITKPDYSGEHVLFHFTSESGMRGILASGTVAASMGSGSRAVHGQGVYMTDIDPGSAALGDPWDMSVALFSTPFVQQKVTNYVEIDVSGLPIENTGPVYSNPVYSGFANYYHAGSMDVVGRVIAWGRVNYRYQGPPISQMSYSTPSLLLPCDQTLQGNVNVD